MADTQGAKKIDYIGALKNGASFIQHSKANKLIESKIEIEDNIRQKIDSLNSDFAYNRDQTIAARVEECIVSLASLLHEVHSPNYVKNDKFSADEVYTAYKALGISYPGTSFEFLIILHANKKDKDLTDSVFNLRKLTKKSGDRVRHNNFDSSNEMSEIVSTYNTVVERIAVDDNLPSVRRFLIKKKQNNQNQQSNKSKHKHQAKNYKCPVCGKKFAIRDGLELHSKDVHGNKVTYLPGKATPINTERMHEFNVRTIFSFVIGGIVLITSLIVLPVVFGVKFTDALWISAISFYVATAATYGFFKGKIGYKIVSKMFGNIYNLGTAVEQSYSINKFGKIMLTILIWGLLFPLALIFSIIFAIVVYSVIFIFVFIFDAICCKDFD